MFSKNEKAEVSWLLREKYGDFDLEKIHSDDKERLKKGEPIDYVIGFVDFLGCRIDLSKKPFIPRVETEFWTKRVIEDLSLFRSKRPLRCLDVFAGSGCIGVAILKHIDKTTVDFVDNDEKALEQIAINLRLNGISDKRYRLIKSDIFQNVDGHYDFILANPPYVPEKDIENVQKSVLEFEPREAIFGGPDGLFYIKGFLNKARFYLHPAGKIYMEF